MGRTEVMVRRDPERQLPHDLTGQAHRQRATAEQNVGEVLPAGNGNGQPEHSSSLAERP